MESELRVFVVDDDPIVVRALERMLRSYNIAVEAFTSPTAFLDVRRMTGSRAFCSTCKCLD